MSYLDTLNEQHQQMLQKFSYTHCGRDIKLDGDDDAAGHSLDDTYIPALTAYAAAAEAKAAAEAAEAETRAVAEAKARLMFAKADVPEKGPSVFKCTECDL